MNLSAHQQHNAIGIIAAVRARQWSRDAAIIAVETALDESNMNMIASANVPASQRYPYVKLSWTSDGLGHDHASMGMFQQQTGYAWTPAGYGEAMDQTTIDNPNGWGTPAQLMDAQTSTAKFLDALSHHPWQSMTHWAAAQAVQVSAFGDGSNYRAQDVRATQIVHELWDMAIPETDWMVELMGLYDPNKKLTPAEALERAHFEKTLHDIVWDEVRKPWVDDAQKTARHLNWHLRRLLPGARASDGSK